MQITFCYNGGIQTEYERLSEELRNLIYELWWRPHQAMGRAQMSALQRREQWLQSTIAILSRTFFFHIRGLCQSSVPICNTMIAIFVYICKTMGHVRRELVLNEYFSIPFHIMFFVIMFATNHLGVFFIIFVYSLEVFDERLFSRWPSGISYSNCVFFVIVKDYIKSYGNLAHKVRTFCCHSHFSYS